MKQLLELDSHQTHGNKDGNTQAFGKCKAFPARISNHLIAYSSSFVVLQPLCHFLVFVIGLGFHLVCISLTDSTRLLFCPKLAVIFKCSFFWRFDTSTLKNLI